MNYRHIYHAGNFADVIKHLVLIAVLENLVKKEKPYYFLDAFAGIGKYDLNSCEASKTMEADFGVNLVNGYKGALPSLLQKYKDMIAGYNFTNEKTYPGSPLIISNYIREGDKADFCELHPDDYEILEWNLRGFLGCKTHNTDGYKAINALLPPKQKRGVVFLDPPFEVTDEFEKIIAAIEIINKKFGHAIVAIWYPIKDYKQVKLFYQKVIKFNKEALKIEFSLPKMEKGLTSTGLLLLNPPYIIDEIRENLEFLKHYVYLDEANFTISLLA